VTTKEKAIDTLLSTDVGAEVDDQWAIAHLALSPRVNLLGIVTTHTPYLRAQRSAEIAQEVRMVSMAFHSVQNGGREFNVQNDPKAWQVILETSVPLTIGCAEMCIRYLTLSRERAKERFGGISPAADYLVGLLEWWFAEHSDTCRAVTGKEDAWPIWDETVTAHLLGLTEVELLPRPRLLDNLDLEFRSGGDTVRWIKAVRADALWSDLMALLRG
jgi:inosine-uridine nucleoside N-ribohydrolase